MVLGTSGLCLSVDGQLVTGWAWLKEGMDMRTAEWQGGGQSWGSWASAGLRRVPLSHGGRAHQSVKELRGRVGLPGTGPRQHPVPGVGAEGLEDSRSFPWVSPAVDGAR